MSATVEQGGRAFARRAWKDAFAALSEAAEQHTLSLDDYGRLAVSAYLIGADDASARAWEGAHRVAREMGDAPEAARCAFWLAFCLMMGGQMAQARGWLGRAERIIEEESLDCAASGYVLIPKIMGSIDEGDAAAARDLAIRASETGDRFDDPDLRAFGTLGQGRALIALGDVTAGTAHFDEVMVAVTAGEVGPITSGIVYCAVIVECMDLLDLHRASEWTDALSRWCEEQPDLVPYRGQCLVHRSQLQVAAGEWVAAIASVAAAREQLTDPPHPALGLAHYQEGELHRLRGETEAAAAAYRHASRHGHEPMPGLALLDLSRGNKDAAVAGIRRALDESHTPGVRPALLAAAVDVLRSSGDVAGARSAVDELTELASHGSSDVMDAIAAQAGGSVLMAEGEPRRALSDLRRAIATWRSIPMPYEAARTSVLIGLSCSALGDRTSAALEFENAREIFTELGAVPDLERLRELSEGLVDAAGDDSTLSSREREVLTHVAAGETNREIADALVISQHTVGRHLENIFKKIGVTTRAAATAYAYEHDLV